MESNGTISVLGHSPQDKPECPPSYDVVEENHSGTYNKSLDATSRIDEQHPNRRGYWGRQANDRRSWNLPEAVPQQYFNSRITPLTNDERSQELNDSPYPSSEGVTSPQSDTAERVIRGLKVPVNITVAAAKAFHNAPRLYGDPTVRENRKVTGIASGFKEAGKELGFGFYDGFTGLVTQPINGAIQQGPLGFAKGLISGSMGVLIKPGAAASGLVGYSLKGLHKELEKRALKAEAKMAVTESTTSHSEAFQFPISGPSNSGSEVQTMQHRRHLLFGTQYHEMPTTSTIFELETTCSSVPAVELDNNQREQDAKEHIPDCRVRRQATLPRYILVEPDSKEYSSHNQEPSFNRSDNHTIRESLVDHDHGLSDEGTETPETIETTERALA